MKSVKRVIIILPLRSDQIMPYFLEYCDIWAVSRRRVYKHCLKTGIIAEANLVIARQRLRKHVPTRKNRETIAIAIHADTGC
jgi:chromosome condensin MukBEF complex kleisin-like MukF subunit